MLGERQKDDRVKRLLGEAGLRLLEQARVAVVGVGGVGSYAVEALARAPVRHLLLVDPDRVAVSDINRQLHATHATIGKPKVEVMCERVRAINPEAEAVGVFCRLTAANAAEIIGSEPTWVIDAIDDPVAKVALLAHCVAARIPVVSSMGAAGRLDPGRIMVDDISVTRVCPLARRLRKALRQHGIESGIRVVYSTEEPIVAQAGFVTDPPGERRPQPTISYLPAAFGLHCAAVVIRSLLDGLYLRRRGEGAVADADAVGEQCERT